MAWQQKCKIELLHILLVVIQKHFITVILYLFFNYSVSKTLFYYLGCILIYLIKPIRTAHSIGLLNYLGAGLYLNKVQPLSLI